LGTSQKTEGPDFSGPFRFLTAAVRFPRAPNLPKQVQAWPDFIVRHQALCLPSICSATFFRRRSAAKSLALPSPGVIPGDAVTAPATGCAPGEDSTKNILALAKVGQYMDTTLPEGRQQNAAARMRTSTNTATGEKSR
jgi:hypothetical protein